MRWAFNQFVWKKAGMHGVTLGGGGRVESVKKPKVRHYYTSMHEINVDYFSF